ncbi:hypothetical protein L3Y34_014468 [Caenorhabditis briggsae]|uniref:HORMA domain-containing protein n=1 Tax=Caenorhabditis briggsae TaxID=6238 RepID=A0AAE9DT55_CAEBR|nr:hypothetical protein L3Y34_014468 [Caenorhabditis briggsae]
MYSPNDEFRQNESLFNDETLKAKNKVDSLMVLGNCVWVVTSTILRERKLFPADTFSRLCVYDNVYGYVVNETSPGGEKLAAKMSLLLDAIKAERIHKLALVFEKTLNTDALETFVWNFAYGDSVLAEFESPGGKQRFKVNCQDMKDTCRQFCDLFSKLRSVLKSLEPLPKGLIPSFRVAHRGDNGAIEGFEQVPEFVNLDTIELGNVHYPADIKFHLAYASKFKKTAEPCEPPFENNAGSHNNVDMKLYQDDNDEEMEVHDDQIETIRENTMGHQDEDDDFQQPIDHEGDNRIVEEPDNSTMDEAQINPVNDAPADEIHESGEPMDEETTYCNPNIGDEISHQAKNEDNENFRDNGLSPTHTSPVGSKLRKDSMKKKREVKSKEKTSNAKKSLLRNKKEANPQRKSSRRSNRIIASAHKSSEAETAELLPERLDENFADNVDVCADNIREFGRVKSVFANEEATTEHPETKQEKSMKVSDQLTSADKRYGSSAVFGTQCREEHEESEPRAHTTPPEDTPRRYGRISSILNESGIISIREKPSDSNPRVTSKRKFGRFASVRSLQTSKEKAAEGQVMPMLAQKDVQHAAANEENEQMEIGDMVSVLDDENVQQPAVANDEVRIEASARYGRVSVLSTETKLKYSQSASLRPK